MGRLLTMATHGTDNQMMFDMTYEYDAVGSALKMTQSSNPELTGPQDAVTTWLYDDRYRLTNETVIVDGASSFVTNSTAYAWDDADNRLSMTKTVDGASSSVTTYTNNALNQMTGWGNGVTNVTYAYDANGNRRQMHRNVDGTSSSVTYDYDADNRMISVSDNTPNSSHTFSYDYRSRRYYRSTPSTPHMYSVFDGGLSIQEYEPASANLTLNPLTLNTLHTEFVRGEGMGGGVGGMVYSIKRDLTPNTQNLTPTIICSHANHRGDVIARSDETGSLTSFALYEAYGTRPYEWPVGGTGDPDRQKANTKEEETDLNLLNEGMRYRDLETGVFLTRDPLKYWDGPNMYCYVHCNPITRFDALGLEGEDSNDGSSEEKDSSMDGSDASKETTSTASDNNSTDVKPPEKKPDTKAEEAQKQAEERNNQKKSTDPSSSASKTSHQFKPSGQEKAGSCTVACLKNAIKLLTGKDVSEKELRDKVSALLGLKDGHFDKSKPGLFNNQVRDAFPSIASEHGVTVSSSLMIGDKTSPQDVINELNKGGISMVSDGGHAVLVGAPDQNGQSTVYNPMPSDGAGINKDGQTSSIPSSRIADNISNRDTYMFNFQKNN
jgi:RHS repeat-associated protein